MSPKESCILEVEDDKSQAFLLQYAFEQAGITNAVHVATDGQMAIEYLAGSGPFADRVKYPLPKLVMLDLNLPRKTGLEVLEWTRQQPALKRLVVILFTSSCLPADIDRAYDLGANSFIQKPADLADALEMAQLLKGWWLGYNHFAVV